MGLFFDKKFRKIVPTTYCKNGESSVELHSHLGFKSLFSEEIGTKSQRIRLAFGHRVRKAYLRFPNFFILLKC